jgi:D-lactate dehydrogenase (cytochrome)
MPTSSNKVQSYLSDASNLPVGRAERVVFPETVEGVADVLAASSRDGVPVTVSGAGTGVVGGRVPFGGTVLATDRLNRIIEIVKGETSGGRATVEAGVTLADLRRAVESQGMLYPPDPTEWSCYVGGTVATNASGARTFKYGPTRNYVRRLKVALAGGDIVDLRRGDALADADGNLSLPLPGGRAVELKLPTYTMPRTRKHAAGYFVEPGMDAVDLFVGSEGTLGVVCEVEAALLPRPENFLAGVVFFESEDDLLAFVREARERSLRTRAEQSRTGQQVVYPDRGSPGSEEHWPSMISVDARALEYFDAESLKFLRPHYPEIPAAAVGAVFFEQEFTEDTEADYVSAWLAMLQSHRSMSDHSWYAVGERDQGRLREFRHALPVLVNEWLARRGQRKVSTDMAVPDDCFTAMLAFYREALGKSGLSHVIFGHIGDNHVHVNILPRDDAEAARARELYGRFIRRAVELGGTVSAEHGVGLREMAALKRALDPACILGRGTMFDEKLLANSY